MFQLEAWWSSSAADLDRGFKIGNRRILYKNTVSLMIPMAHIPPQSKAAVSDPGHPPAQNPVSLEQLIARGDIWRGGNSAPAPALRPSGLPELDRALGGGWPERQLIEVCQAHGCHAEWLLLAPALAGRAQLCALVNPPASPFAEGLRQAGVDSRWLWSVAAPGKREFLSAILELARTAVAGAALGWAPANLSYTELRKLQLAAAEAGGLVVVFRPLQARRLTSPAPLRLGLRPGADALQIEIFKRKGLLAPQAVELPWPAAWAPHTPWESAASPAAERDARG